MSLNREDVLNQIKKIVAFFCDDQIDASEIVSIKEAINSGGSELLKTICQSPSEMAAAISFIHYSTKQQAELDAIKQAANLMGKAIFEREQAVTTLADCLEHLHEHLTCIDTQYHGSPKHERLHADLQQVIDTVQSIITNG